MRADILLTIARRSGVAVLAALGSFGAAQAGAIDCGAGVDARFSEAASLCGAAAPRARRATLSDRPSAVSVSYAAARQPRVRRAVAAVARSGGANNDALIRQVGRNYRVDPHLLAAMVRAESAGRPDAVSHKGALGLMQVMPGTARSLGVRQPGALLKDPHLALSTGALYLKTLQARFGNNLPLVVAAYNAGPGAVTKAGMRVPKYRETQGYVGTVLGRYARSRGNR